jgi:hypothetical protein
MWLLALALPEVWLGAALRREGMGSWICVGRVSIEERRSLVAFEEGASDRCELVLRLVKELGVD